MVTVNQRLDGLEEMLDKRTTMTEWGALADIADEDEVAAAGSKKKDRSQRAFNGLYFPFFLKNFEKKMKKSLFE